MPSAVGLPSPEWGSDQVLRIDPATGDVVVRIDTVVKPTSVSVTEDG
jgi:hypothetical protein